MVDRCAFWSDVRGRFPARSIRNAVRLLRPQSWSARESEKRVSVWCGGIGRNVGQEVKEVDRDLSVVCPGRQLNL